VTGLRGRVDAGVGRSAILGAMKVYCAGPLFTSAERAWNADLAAALRAGGHEVFLPQEQEPGKTAVGIFASDVGGIDWAEVLVAVMDGPDPDAGTAWECGYAHGRKPVILVRTDLRGQTGSVAPYNLMLTESATVRLDLPMASSGEVGRALLAALGTIGTIEARR
jgi:nucleoside 2-deoxyribosyltransferase